LESIIAPARTPPHIADLLFVEINRALENPELRKRWQALGVVPRGSASRAAFVKFIREDTARWAKIIKDANLQLE
jgi:tripartite-type tricarboxylate transporter receptor subunit TctC